jgi:hypothetical protein
MSKKVQLSHNESHSQLMRDIQLKVGYQQDARLFKNQVGKFLQVNCDVAHALRVLRAAGITARIIATGLCKGSGDLVGWVSRMVEPAMVGQRVAIFTNIEGKTGRGHATAEQANFIEAVLRHGGRAGIARDVDDARKILDPLIPIAFYNAPPDSTDFDPTAMNEAVDTQTASTKPTR